ncbi:MAG TPA: histidine phosphatase family protein [Kineosporiaceae bacterium]|nr:histidine phosphatase family protein [Kineosporiaceae bacterium]
MTGTAGDRTVVHLLRHGEVHNPDKLLYGRLPGYRLSDLGQRMAERAAEYFAGRDVVRLVSSPLERARQTAEPLAAALGLEVGVDDRLLESENVFEGRSVGVGDGALRSPSAWWHLRNPFLPSWGEPYTRVALRMHAAAEVAREAARGHEAVLVSHQLPIWVARLSAEHRHLWHDPRKRQCSLASVTSFTYQGDRLVSVSYAEPAADLLPTASTVPGA